MSVSETPPPIGAYDAAGCATSETYALRVLGDSMEPEFADGSIIIVEPGGNVENGSYVIAHTDGEYIFRQFITKDGRSFLKALNPGYADVAVPGPEVVCGVVTQRAGTHRRHHKHYTD